MYLSVYACLNTPTNLIVYLWPLRTLSNRTVPKKKRISLIFTFVLGCIACAASIVRIIFLSLELDPRDVMYSGLKTTAIAIIELNLGIMCAALPGTKPVMKEVEEWQATVGYGVRPSRGGSPTPRVPMVKYVPRDVPNSILSPQTTRPGPFSGHPDIGTPGEEMTLADMLNDTGPR
jgi:hypothetical protein